MSPQELNFDGQSAPLAPTDYSMIRAFTFILPFAFLIGFFLYLLCPCFCSMAKRARVIILAALPNALKTNTKHASYRRPGPIPSEHHDATPTPEVTPRIELLCQRLATMTIQRDEAVDLSKDIANERDKFKTMFGTARMRLEDSRAKVRSLNTEVTGFLANSIAAKARNEMLRDGMAADAARAKAEKMELQESIDNLSVENSGLLKAAEAESAFLRQQVKSLETKMGKYQHSVNVSAKKARTTGLETGALREQVVILETENENMQGAIRKLSIDSGLMDLEKQKLQDAFNKLSINAEALQAQNNKLQDAIDNLFAEKAELFKAAEMENGSLRQVTNLETANKILRNENKSLLEDLKVLSTTSSARVEALETSNSKLQESANMSTEASHTLSRELDDVKAKYSELKDQLSLANTARDDAVRYAVSLRQALTSTTTDLKHTRATLNLRDQDVEETKQQHKLTLKKQHELAQAVQKSTNDTLAAEQRTTQTLRNKITDLEHEPSRRWKMLEAQMAQQQVQIAKLEKELDGRIAEIQTKDTEIADLTRDLRGKGATATRASDAQDGIDDLFIGADEIGKLEEELARVKREHGWEIKSIRKEMDGLRRGVEEKEREIETWRAGRDLMEKREDDAKARIAVLKERVGQLEMRLI